MKCCVIRYGEIYSCPLWKEAHRFEIIDFNQLQAIFKCNGVLGDI